LSYTRPNCCLSIWLERTACHSKNAAASRQLSTPGFQKTSTSRVIEANSITLEEFVDRAVYFAWSTNRIPRNCKWEEFAKVIGEFEEEGDPCLSKK